MATKFFYKDGTSYEGYYGKAPHYGGGKKILHREDGPAIIWPNGKCEYYVNGKLHRWGGYAIGHSYYLEGILINNKSLYERIEKISLEEDLLKYLLDNSVEIRLIAKYKFKELERCKLGSTTIM